MSNKESSAMERTRKLVTAKRGAMTVTQACEKTGIARNSVYRARWYKTWKANQQLNKE
ncbi:MAG: hypothetical protein JO253_03190 [Alphaproteobacteria bacterium]|nr:hypothetical protein [Alphaproteobacteria bacterium]